MPMTHSPDPVHLGVGAGTAAAQSNVPRLAADPDGTGWVDYDSVPRKSEVKPTDMFPAEATVTGEDATNAAKLAGLGYVARNPATAWNAGQQFNVGTYRFHWTGSAWAAGPKPA